jgi:cytochrome c oxidase assembly protein subunit 15
MIKSLRTMREVKSLLRPLALASLIANIGLIVTGGAVRLTGSGLGCPTWPKCTEASYRTTEAMGVHGAIEFGNRMLNFVLVAVALGCVIEAIRQRPRRRSLIALSIGVIGYIPVQIVLGGITVLTKLNPWAVGLHFLASIGLIAVAYALWRRTAEGDRAPRPLVPAPLRQLGALTAIAGAAVIAVGVVVTGSGPHAGDEHAKRTGLDPAAVSQAHADLVFLLVGLTVALVLALRATQAPAAAVRAAAVLLAIELGQGVIGFVQYFTHLPIVLVGVHLLGAALVWVGILNVLWSMRSRDTGPGTEHDTGVAQPLQTPSEPRHDRVGEPLGRPSRSAVPGA